MAKISIEKLRTLCETVLASTSMRDVDVQMIVDHFLENELSGKRSHGLVRIVEARKILKKYPLSKEDPEVEKDNGALMTMNAHGQIGVVAGFHAVQAATERAEKYGIALIGIHNFISNSGSMAYYLRRLAAKGLVAIMGTNSIALVAPPKGKKRMIGTNPFGACIPGKNGDDFIFDMATSAIAYGKTMVLKDQGKDVPDGLIIDKDGNNATDPEKIYDGAILPLAGYKGFGLGLMIELLAGPLIGGKAIKDELYVEDGLYIIVIDPKQIAAEGFYAHISQALKELRNSPLRPGEKEITLPGERSKITLQASLDAGEIDVVDETLAQLKELSKT